MSIQWEKIVDEYIALLLHEETEVAIQKTRELLNDGVTPTEFFENCISPALQEVGRQFETLEIFLPEMVIAAEVVEEINAQVIRPAIESAQANSGVVKIKSGMGKVLLATIQGDLHDIGKNMVTLILQVNGFEVKDLGVNVPPQDIVNAALAEEVDIIGLSSLLTSCLPYMKDVVNILESKGIREKYAVIIGGAAPTEDFTNAIGADAQGHNAAEAVRICKQIMVNREAR